MGEEVCLEGVDAGEDYRTTTIRRLWKAAATGRLNLGTTSRELKSEQWIELVQWLIKHVDQAATDQWEWQGHYQAGVDTGLDVVQAIQEVLEDDEATREESGPPVPTTWEEFVTAVLGEDYKPEQPSRPPSPADSAASVRFTS